MSEFVATNRCGNKVLIEEKFIYSSTDYGKVTRCSHKRLDNGRINYYYYATLPDGSSKVFNTKEKAYDYLTYHYMKRG